MELWDLTLLTLGIQFPGHILKPTLLLISHTWHSCPGSLTRGSGAGHDQPRFLREVQGQPQPSVSRDIEQWLFPAHTFALHEF